MFLSLVRSALCCPLTVLPCGKPCFNRTILVFQQPGSFTFAADFCALNVVYVGFHFVLTVMQSGS